MSLQRSNVRLLLLCLIGGGLRVRLIAGAPAGMPFPEVEAEGVRTGLPLFFVLDASVAIFGFLGLC